MDQSSVSAVKLTSLGIVNFKRLEKGNIEWNVPSNFGVIATCDALGKFKNISLHSTEIQVHLHHHSMQNRREIVAFRSVPVWFWSRHRCTGCRSGSHITVHGYWWQWCRCTFQARQSAECWPHGEILWRSRSWNRCGFSSEPNAFFA